MSKPLSSLGVDELIKLKEKLIERSKQEEDKKHIQTIKELHGVLKEIEKRYSKILYF